ncbi:hypothetical protein P7K49_024904 [Saguinus oedipus]|uniref:Uncharacterized protein n=1 Tax=Saguinus oedipus TaxID=9490 RepID=A0ABQ9UFQ9_SAGOE|nr:hypothetical protein P7K49_024904 [Saguinus oedipus]
MGFKELRKSHNPQPFPAVAALRHSSGFQQDPFRRPARASLSWATTAEGRDEPANHGRLQPRAPLGFPTRPPPSPAEPRRAPPSPAEPRRAPPSPADPRRPPPTPADPRPHTLRMRAHGPGARWGFS